MNDPASASPVAIVGIGCMFPGAPDLEAFWANVRDGVDAITQVPESHFSLGDYYDPDPKAADRTYGRKGGFLSPVAFDPMRYGIPPKDIPATDTTQLLGLMAAEAALRDAGYVDGDRELPRERTSVILGVTGALELVVPLGARLGHPIWRRALAEAGVDEAVAQDVVRRISDAYVPWQENSFPGLLGNVAAGRIANRLDLHGTNCVVDAACASSLSALHLGLLELRSGKADVVLAGGLDTFNDIFMYTCFSKTPALSPGGDARPFDDEGDGTTLGEGLGILVLKRLEDAERDGDRVYAVVRGLGSSSDGRGQAIYAPAAQGQARALRNAYQDADVSPETIELIEAHGTGTRVGDATEIEGLTTVFADGHAAGTREPWCALGSVKSMIGHAKAAAGAAGLIKTAMALHHRVLPPTLKVQRPNAAVASPEAPLYVNTVKRPWIPRGPHPRRAGVSAFGFGGSNFHCVLEEHGSAPADAQWDGRVQLLAWSGARPRDLITAVREFADGVAREDAWSFVRTQAAAQRRAFDSSAAHRLVVPVAHDEPDLPGRLRGLAEKLGDASGAFTTPAGDAYGAGTTAGKVGILFPGQGAQRVGMLRDLACTFGEFVDTLTEIERSVPGVAQTVYPIPAFDEETTKTQAETLRATQNAQPALGAVSLAAWRVLARFGLQAHAAAGHSYGELVALCAAGSLSHAALFELSRRRGEAMASGAGDLGGMLAVAIDLAQLEAWRQEHAPDLTLANRNAPRQGVLSGPTPAIDAAEALLRQQGIGHRRLWVGAAFHSPVVAGAVTSLSSALAEIPMEPGRIPVYANTTAAPYPAHSEAARALLAGQLAAPVDFVGCIENMWADGVRIFVEVGPGRRLTGLVRSILGDRAAITTAVEGSEGRRHGVEDLARALASLAAAGVAIDLGRWDPAPRCIADKPGPAAIVVQGAHPRPVVVPRPPVAPSAPVASRRGHPS